MRRIITLTIYPFVVGVCACRSTSDWSAFQHDAGRGGYRDERMTMTPKPYWRVTLSESTDTLTPPVFGKCRDTVRIFVGSGHGRVLYALSPKTGEVLWTLRSNDRNGFYGAPATDGCSLYVALGQRTTVETATGAHVYAIDQSTSKVRWSAPVGSNGSVTAVAVGLGLVFVHAGDHTLTAFEQDRGRRAWSAPFADDCSTAESAPAIGRQRVFVGGADGLYAFDAKSGGRLWRFAIAGGVGSSSPVVYSKPPYNFVIIGGRDDEWHAVDAERGTPQWFQNDREASLTTAAIADEKVFLFSGTFVRAMDVVVGSLRSNGWSEFVGLPRPRYAPAISGRTLFFTTGETVGSIDARTGEQRWIAPLPGDQNAKSGAAMALGLDILLVPSRGQLHAFR